MGLCNKTTLKTHKVTIMASQPNSNRLTIQMAEENLLLMI